jgi:NitT/TauT family transport system substrate-binding protein
MRLSRSRFLTSAGLGLAGAAVPRIGRGQETTLRMAVVLSDSFGEPLYAKDAGAFARRGFGVEVSSMNNAAAVVAAIAGGSLELGIGDLVSGVNAINAGVPILLVAGSGLYQSSEPFTILTVAANSPLRVPRDLNGKSIGDPTLVGLTTACLRAWLPQNGVDLSGVKIVEVPQPAAVPALERGTVDCVLLGEPFLAPNRSKIRDIGHPFDVIGKTFCISVWYASKSWVEADPARARRAVAAIYDTARWANTHRPETAAILVRDAHFDAAGLQGMIRTTFATSLTPAQVQPVLDIALQAKIFANPVDANAIIAKL